MPCVGELSLLTGEPRSAGVRARRDATLIEVPRDGLRRTARHATRAATRTVLTQVAERCAPRARLRRRERAVQPQVIAVVGLHAGSGCEDGRRTT